VSDLTASLAVEMIHATTRRLDGASSELSRLDAVAGDGDHGVNMAAAFHAAEESLGGEPPVTPGEVFASVGRSFSVGAGGSAGALFGAMFGAIGTCLGRSSDPGVVDLVEGLELAAKRVALIGQTAPGSKTMLDALTPAAAAARIEADREAPLAGVLHAAAVASERGAEATATMRAAAGRARHASDGALGTKDPGAVTVALMFGAWDEAVSQGAAL
jgi:dihydroxyacetone kinase